ncbi:hypothetical protein DXG01_007829, partial [Tephrocybe rancida]
VWDILRKDAKKPIDERYVHNIKVTGHGGTLIFTFHPYLLGLVHEAVSLFINTTFKRAVGELKELEVAMWAPSVQRAVTIGRIYSDRADREQYKAMFDEFRYLVLNITGKPLLLKQLSKGGTLISFNVDLEIAQVLGCGDSFVDSNEPEFSGIPIGTPIEVFVQYFICGCYAHAKRGIASLRTYVTHDQFDRIRYFMYLKTKTEVEEFGTWIATLEAKEVKDWWAHKINNKWILPSLVPCLTKITPEDWAITQSTSNIGESQHQWTNRHTSIKLSLLEAILTAHKLDSQTADEIRNSSKTGVLRNNRNDSFHRMSRNIARTNAANHKACETKARNSAIGDLDEEIQALKQTQKENQEKLKAAKAQKAQMSGKGQASKSRAESNSSGRVASSSRRTKAARVLSGPYPSGKPETETTASTPTDTPLGGLELEMTLPMPTPTLGSVSMFMSEPDVLQHLPETGTVSKTMQHLHGSLLAPIDTNMAVDVPGAPFTAMAEPNLNAFNFDFNMSLLNGGLGGTNVSEPMLFLGARDLEPCTMIDGDPVYTTLTEHSGCDMALDMEYSEDVFNRFLDTYDLQ